MKLRLALPSWVMLMPAIVCAFASASAAASPLTEQQQQSILASAQASYQLGVELRRTNPDEATRSFVEAANRFKQLVDANVTNGYLLYNLANAQLQADELGQAILNYRRAERLIGHDDRLQTNLEYARGLCEDRIERSSRTTLTNAVLSWHRNMSLKTRFVIFSGAYTVFFLLMIVRMYVPVPGVRGFAVACAVVATAFGGSVATDTVVARNRVAGVILDNEVIVRKGNGEGFEPQFDEPLHEGVEFDVLEQRGEWIRLQLVNDKTGWVPRAAVGLSTP